jgi:hypothetical protein
VAGQPDIDELDEDYISEVEEQPDYNEEEQELSDLEAERLGPMLTMVDTPDVSEDEMIPSVAEFDRASQSSDGDFGMDDLAMKDSSDGVAQS